MTGESGKAMPGSRTDDQVVRLMNFSQAHPEVTIGYRPEAWRWEAAYPAENGTREIQAAELRAVLDALERHFGPIA